jgi:F-type H+-transporting ATPase subunit gamma
MGLLTRSDIYLLALTVKMRMRSVGNTKKITAAMKMVAASKMRVSEIVSMRSRGIVEPFIKVLGDNPGVPPSQHW